MNRGGAPIGNKNGSKNKAWSDLIRRVAMRDKKRLERIAEALLRKCEEGDLPALREFGDRFEGKIPQATELSGSGGGELIIKLAAADAEVL